MEQAIEIHGHGFKPRTVMDLADGPSLTVSDRFEAWLEPEDATGATDDIPLSSVRRTSSTTLTAAVPASVPIGGYRLWVKAPDGVTVSLSMAYRATGCETSAECANPNPICRATTCQPCELNSECAALGIDLDYCDLDTGACVVFPDRCGNGVLDPFEDCDDGNNVNGDGCQADCTLPGCTDCDSVGIAVWNRYDEPGSLFSTWNGTTFSSPAPTSATVGHQQVETAASPSTGDMVVVGADAVGNLTAQVHNGTDWSPHNWGTPTTVAAANQHGFAVAVESLSGRPMVVWSNGNTSDENVSYRLWDGQLWTDEENFHTPRPGIARHLHLGSHPAADELVLVVRQLGGGYAKVWDGAHWGNGVILDAGVCMTDISLAHEQQSGRAAICYGKSAEVDVFCRVWTGITWLPESRVAAPPTVTDPVRWTQLRADPGSDRMVLVSTTDSGNSDTTIWLSAWDGAAWAPPVVATDAQRNNLSYPNASVAFEQLSGDALVVYAETESATAVSFRRWTPGGGWSAAQLGPALGDNPTVQLLYPDPLSDDIMLGSLTNTSELYFTVYTAGSWSTPTLLDPNVGTNRHAPFAFQWLAP